MSNLAIVASRRTSSARWRRASIRTTAGLLPLVWCAAARAQTLSPLVTYSAPAECPERAEFLQQVEIRLSKPFAELATPQEPHFTATVKVSGATVQGTLVVVEPGGAQSVRRVPGRSCAEVVAAMSLITALTLDPNASTAPQPARPLRPRPAPRPTPAPPPRPVAPVRTKGWRLGFGVAAATNTAAPPPPALDVEPFVALDDEAPRLFAPEFRLSALRSVTPSTVTKSLGEADFTWTAARLAACPLKWPARSALELRPCAVLDAGVLNGSGTRTHKAASANALWIAPGLTARLTYRPIAALSLEVGAGATFPLERGKFYFQPNAGQNVVAFHVPPAGAIGSIGVAVWLP